MINMASPSDVRPRRDSSTRSSSSKRRPRLLRASATEPSITTSNASRNSLASSHCTRRATELLNNVAYSAGSPPDSIIRPSSPMSTRSGIFDSPDRQSNFSTSPVSHQDGFDDIPRLSYSGRYFSFPSFDMYEDQQEKETEPKSP